jgi:hypothetical protein
LLLGIEELVQKISKLINPITFVLTGGDASLKKEAGFAKKTEPGIPESHYVLRIIK